jgi:hypothetical protein
MFEKMANQQRILTLAFLSPTSDDYWVNRLAAKASSHPFCHVELFFESIGQSFSIMWGEVAGFRFKNLSNPNYSLISLAVTAKEYDTCLEFCKSVASQNLGFDDRGMWASWFSSTLCCSSCDASSQHKGVTFCSKIITEALQFAGMVEVDKLSPGAATPSRLFEQVRGSRRLACSSVPFKRQALITLSSLH